MELSNFQTLKIELEEKLKFFSRQFNEPRINPTLTTVEILRHGKLVASFLTLPMTNHAHFTCIPLHQLNRIIQHPGRLGSRITLTRLVVNYYEQTYTRHLSFFDFRSNTIGKLFITRPMYRVIRATREREREKERRSLLREISCTAVLQLDTQPLTTLL